MWYARSSTGRLWICATVASLPFTRVLLPNIFSVVFGMLILGNITKFVDESVKSSVEEDNLKHLDKRTWQFNDGAQGGDKTHNAQPFELSKQILDKAIEVGINFLDTAEAYPNSEDVLGRILEGRRKDVIIASKFGARVPDYNAEEIEKSLTTSLQRLRTNYIDLYQIHWPSYVTGDLDGAVAELKRLQAKGLIRYYGVCNFGPQNIKNLMAAGATPVSNQISYSMLWRPVENEILPVCQANNMGVLAYSPLQQGLLTGRYRKLEDVPEGRRRTRLFNSASTELSRHGQKGAETEMFQAIARIQEICDKVGVSMPVAALSWLLQQPAVSSVIAGSGSPAQVEHNVKLVKLQQDIVKEFDAATDELKTMFGSSADMWAPQSRIA